MTFTHGSITFDDTISGFKYERERQDVLVYDCHPTPGGSSRRFPLDDDLLDDVFDPRFLQGGERKKMLEGARKADEKTLTEDELLAKILKEIKESQNEFRVKDVDLKGIPKKWKGVQPCVTKTISVKLHYWTLQLQAKAAKDLKLDGETFPKGDVVASFRYIIPTRYQFLLLTEGNPKCCQGDQLPKDRVHDASDSFSKFKVPAIDGITLENFGGIEEFRIEGNTIRPQAWEGPGVVEEMRYQREK